MSKKQKRLKELFSRPPPRDFTWENLVAVMASAGFSNHCDHGGSHYIFEHVNGYRVSMCKTHPGGILKAYQVKNAKEALIFVNEGPED